MLAHELEMPSQRDGILSCESRINSDLSRHDLTVNVFVRTEGETVSHSGERFGAFLKRYQRPTAIYRCTECNAEEARVVEEESVDRFLAQGGNIWVSGNLELVGEIKE